MASRPNWLEFREVTSTPAELLQLDDGEREAIALARTTGTTLILLDEKKGRQAARKHGLSVAGTLGVIDLAARRGLISLLDALKNLERTNFRASPQLIRAIIESS